MESSWQSISEMIKIDKHGDMSITKLALNGLNFENPAAYQKNKFRTNKSNDWRKESVRNAKFC